MAFIPEYILILLVTIVIDYWAAKRIEDTAGKEKKSYLILSIISTILVLAVFKYFNFFNINFAAIANAIGWNYPVNILSIILPIGLSFHTFQSLSYVIEVYRGKFKAERHFGIYSLYVMFYPQLVAGPIERPQNLIHQFYEKHYVDAVRISEGLRKMLWGFFKKIVVADNLAVYVNQAYADPTQFSGLVLLTASIFFAIQIYCDFSGYSDIAIGAAKVMGFNLMENFKNPYFAKSISEFWKRWHISLSTWFKDYVYIPLGGNRVSTPRWAVNILATFILSGFWHGANWTYIIWGFIHGSYLVLEKWMSVLFNRVTVLILVLIAWVFFRANTVSDAIYIIRSSAHGLRDAVFGNFGGLLEPLSYDRPYFFLIMGILAVFAIAETIDYRKNIVVTVGRLKPAIRYIVYFIAIMSILNLGVTHEIPFIYFQF